jgi:hypothetical protein
MYKINKRYKIYKMYKINKRYKIYKMYKPYNYINGIFGIICIVRSVDRGAAIINGVVESRIMWHEVDHYVTTSSTKFLLVPNRK